MLLGDWASNGNAGISDPGFVLIQYPGIIKNMDKALDTLGGLQQIQSCHFANRALELRHTPGNPYTSSLTSDKKEDSKVTSGTLRLVMTIRRKKKNPQVTQVVCHGLVKSMYTFDSMCDFQYLPIKKRQNVEAEIYDDLIPRLIPLDLPSALCWWEKPDIHKGFTPLFLPPFQFSRYSTPSQKILCRETDYSQDKTRRKVGHGQNLRIERKALSITVQANDPFPLEPSREAIEDAAFRCKNEEPHRMMAALFDERPVWTRVAILYKTGLDENLLKSLLPKFAFYIQSGAWGRLWCRFGYDPRKDPKAGQYQTVVVSFRQHAKIPERQRLKLSSSERLCPPADAPPINFVYNKGRLPRVRQMWYCMCDVLMEEAEIAMKADGSTTNIAEKGWINEDAVKALREAIKEDVRKTTGELNKQDIEYLTNEDDF